MLLRCFCHLLVLQRWRLCLLGLELDLVACLLLLDVQPAEIGLELCKQSSL